jgi:hypothetical protein
MADDGSPGDTPGGGGAQGENLHPEPRPRPGLGLLARAGHLE